MDRQERLAIMDRFAIGWELIMVGYVPLKDAYLGCASEEDLDILERRIGEERQRRIKEHEEAKARYARDGCKWEARFIYNHCATCGCDEMEMKNCAFAGSSEDDGTKKYAEIA